MKHSKLFAALEITILLALLVFSFVGCGASSGSANAAAPEAMYETAASYAAASSTAAVAEMPAADDAQMDAGEAGGRLNDLPSVTTGQQPNRKIIRRAYLDLETLDFNGTIESITQQVDALGGYFESSSISGNSLNERSGSGNRSAYIVARIPQDQLNPFIEQIGHVANITHREESSEDITLSYVDLETRRETLITERDRLLELLEQAEDLEGIVQLESRLSEVTYELESITSSLRGYDSLIDYSTVTININEVQQITEVPDQTVGDRIRVGFANTLRDLKAFGQDLVVFVVVNLPYLVIWAVIVLIVVLIARACSRASRRRKANRANLPPYTAYPVTPPTPPAAPTATPSTPPATPDNPESTPDQGGQGPDKKD